MNLLQTIKETVEADIERLKRTRFQAVHTGARDWAQESPLYITREEAQAWLDRQLAASHRKDDDGYIVQRIVESAR